MIDLSSDTATRPTPAMREAIAAAEVGDEQKREDPTVNDLQERVAALLGQEAALFAVTGTMCNRLAVAALTQPGDIVLVEKHAHLLRFESGGPAVMHGVVLDQIEGDRGLFTADQLAAAVIPSTMPHIPIPRVVALEQTHNHAGGTIWPLEQYRAVADVAHAHDLTVHVDGARLLNAVVASGVPADQWGAPVDTIWIDFTKGLGAPIGAVLAGPKDVIEKARRYKHMFGGAMRQAGIAAAGCVHALDHHVDRLADDHANAATLANGLAEAGLDLEAPETNMVYFDPRSAGITASAFCERIEAAGVRMGAIGDRVRAVTHLDVSAAEIDTAVEVCQRTLSTG